MPRSSTPHPFVTTPTNRSHRTPTLYSLTPSAPNGYGPHHHRRFNNPIPVPTIIATAPAVGGFRFVPPENSSARNTPSWDNRAIFWPHRGQLDSSSRRASDESPEYWRGREDALVFGGGRILGIARIADREIYRAGAGARRWGGFAWELFFDGRCIVEEEEEEGEEDDRFVEHFDERDFVAGGVGLGAVDGGYYDGENDKDDMNIITPASTYRCPLTRELECGICMCRKISVQFRECSHALCAPCAKALWRSRMSVFGSCPGSFPCHLCRAEVKEVGKLRVRVPGFGNVYRHGEKKFTVWKWVELRQWASGAKEEKKTKSLSSGVAGLAGRLRRKLLNARFTDGRSLQSSRVP